MRKTHRGSAIGVAGFVICQPSKLACRDRGDRNYTNCVGPRLGSAELFDQIGRGLRRPSVVPQQRRSDDLAATVHTHHAVLLSSDRYGCDVAEPTRCGNCTVHRLEPACRIYLGTDGMRRPPFSYQLSRIGITDNDFCTTG